jgi:hypothetical protein
VEERQQPSRPSIENQEGGGFLIVVRKWEEEEETRRKEGEGEEEDSHDFHHFDVLRDGLLPRQQHCSD